MEKQSNEKVKNRRYKSRREIVSKGVYENGEIKLSGKKLPKGKMNVVVTFKEVEDNKKQNDEKKVDSFIKKWSGVIKHQDLEFVMEKKLEYLVEKHR